MKKLIFTILMSFFILSLCSCSSEPRILFEENPRPEAAANDSSWSVFVYMCGSNGDKSAEAIRELCKREYPQNVNVLIQTGGSGWDISGIDGGFTQRFLVQKGSLFLKDQKQGASMGSHETLSEFLNWGISSYPAEKYMLIVMGDGNGTEVISDKNYNGDSLTVEELSYGVSLTGQKFDIIGFDCPYAASLEFALSLSPYADFMVASEEQCVGFDYGALADDLITYSYALPSEISRLICDDYYEKCIDMGYEKTASMSITDLSHISYLAQAFDAMAGSMRSTLDSLDEYGALSRNALGAQTCAGSGDMVDLSSLASAIAPNVGETAQPVIDALFQTIAYNVKGELRPTDNGLCIYYPQKINEERLNNYMKSTVSDNYKYFVKCISPGVRVVDEYVAEDYNNSWAWCDYVGREFGCSSYMSDDSKYSMSISGAMDIVKDVRLNKYAYSAGNGAYLCIGSDNNLDCNWEGQTYSDNTETKAPTLNGKQIDAVLEDEIRDLGKMYTADLLVNNEVCKLIFFYSWNTGNYETLGLWKDGALLNLKSKDSVTTLHRVLDNDDMTLTGSTFRPLGRLRVKNRQLKNGEYKLEYELEDVYAKLRKTEPATLIKDRNGINIYQ